MVVVFDTLVVMVEVRHKEGLADRVLVTVRVGDTEGEVDREVVTDSHVVIVEVGVTLLH
jgi:hypothetical protein